MVVSVQHTCQLAEETRSAIRPLLDASFQGGFTDDDLDHALGGMHVLVWDDARLIGHASLVQRRILHRDRALRAGYVEGVAVHPDHRSRGHFSLMMGELEAMLRAAYEMGALSASAMAAELYVARGWTRWAGTTSVVSPSGVQRTPDEDGNVYVLQATADLDVAGDLACDWRCGDVW